MATNLHLFRRTKQLELQIDSFFDKLSESSVVYQLAIEQYLKNGPTEAFQSRLTKVNELESEADSLRREIEKPVIPEPMKEGYGELANMVVKAVDELALSGRAFFYSPHDVPAHNHKVILFEKEADAISTKLKTEIFDSDMDLAVKLHLREFVEQIDGIAEDVADRLAIYAIKRMS